MKKLLKYICSNCGKECKNLYYNEKTKGWECTNCKPYLKD